MQGERIGIVVGVIAGLAASLWSDQAVSGSHVAQIRVDFRELGYPPVDVIPPDESAIRALAVAPDGQIFGATSGRRSHLFAFDPTRGSVEPLGFLPGARVVHRALVVSSSGAVYAGTSLEVDNGGVGYEEFEGGRLLRYDPSADPPQDRIRIDRPCPVEDLGVVVKGEGIYALVMESRRNIIYGLTYPSGYMFSRQLYSAETTVFGSVAEAFVPGERWERERNIGRALVVDSAGRVFTSGEEGYIYSADPGTGRVERSRTRLPGIPGRERYTRVDAWATDSQGRLYGGTSDGYLFRFDPGDGHAENLGKPLNQHRVRGLVWGTSGKLYGIGGDTDEAARLFSYDPVRGVYDVLGMIDVDRRPFYSWRGFLFDSIAVGLDGTIYLGQAERVSKLFVYYPE